MLQRKAKKSALDQERRDCFLYGKLRAEGMVGLANIGPHLIAGPWADKLVFSSLYDQKLNFWA